MYDSQHIASICSSGKIRVNSANQPLTQSMQTITSERTQWAKEHFLKWHTFPSYLQGRQKKHFTNLLILTHGRTNTRSLFNIKLLFAVTYTQHLIRESGLKDASIHLRIMIPISHQLNQSRAHSNRIKQHKYSLLNTLCKLHNNLRAVTTELTMLWEAFKDKRLKTHKITWNLKKIKEKEAHDYW